VYLIPQILPELQKDHNPVRKTIKKLIKNPKIMLRKNTRFAGE
jgi:hypothetical protein